MRLEVELPRDESVEAYGALNFDPERYPLLVIKSKIWDVSKPSVLVTGGVHGYETSGVEGALLFLQTKFSAYSSMNFVMVPCVSPWGFEHIQRWNKNADDPNHGLLHMRIDIRIYVCTYMHIYVV